MTDFPFEDDPNESAEDAPSLSVPIAAEQAGERLDKALAAGLPDMSRSRLKSLLEAGCVRLDGRTITDASLRVKPGQVYEVEVPAAAPALPEPQPIPLDIVYEDDDLLVLNKPAGMVVHPAAGNPDGTLVNALLAHCGDSLSGIGGVRRPGIVHRLDKDTSGLMVVAKNDRAHAGLTTQFADRTLSRTYEAVVLGCPSPREGRIEGNIARSSANRQKMTIVESGGKEAVTDYRVIRPLGLAACLVECRLQTGRTHQIRVHMTSIGHPLIGDPLYGRIRPARFADYPEPCRRRVVGFPRQALHARSISFIHPTTGERHSYTVAMPEDMAALIAALEGSRPESPTDEVGHIAK